MAKEAGDKVLGNSQWQISGDFKSLFGSTDLSSNKEVLMYRHYDAGVNVTHCGFLLQRYGKPRWRNIGISQIIHLQ